jgi:ABC-type Fe3+/spermidine/putrescine transport system ATPase subunit
MTASLSLRGLAKRYPGGAVGLEPLSLDVAASELLVVLGQAAAGKTTLLRLIAGLETPSAGLVRIDGEDVTGRRAGRRPVNLVFQGQALFPHLTAAENVGYGLGRGRRDPEAVELVRGALALVGLEAAARMRPDALDDASRRLLAFARALARRPRVLLLDNPLAGLVGREHAELLARILAVQRATGLTVLFATDDPDATLAAGDRAVVLDAGRMHQAGTPADLRERPATRHVARYVARLNVFAGRRLAGGGYAIGDDAPGEAVTLGIAPDRLRPRPSAPAPPSPALAVRALRPVFQGGVRRLLAETLDGMPLVVAAPDSLPREGDVLWVTWTTEDIVPLRDDPPARPP